MTNSVLQQIQVAQDRPGAAVHATEKATTFLAAAADPQPALMVQQQVIDAHTTQRLRLDAAQAIASVMAQTLLPEGQPQAASAVRCHIADRVGRIDGTEGAPVKASQGIAQVKEATHQERLAGIGDPKRKPWEVHYHEITGEPELDAGIFLQAYENKTTRMIGRLRDLARLVRSDSTLRSIFSERQFARLSGPGLRDRPAVRRFRSRFRSFIKRHGRRTGRGFGAASNFATPTWGMRQETPLHLIASYADQDIEAMERIERDAKREREAATKRVREKLAGDPERLARFEDELWRAQDQLCVMEDHNHMMEQATAGALREAIDFVGQFLGRAKRLDEPDDVLHLSMDELRSAAAGAGPGDLRALVRERTAEFEKRSAMRPPPTLGAGKPPALPRIFDPPPNAGRDGMLIRGVAASRGKVTGTARVPPMTAEPPAIEKGDILVATNAGPNWTPIFPLLGGLVLDQGAIFQHAALVAREYKIPAVIMAKDATKEIRDGQTIAVDGDEGVVDLSP